jgi:hypothetical protein
MRTAQSLQKSADRLNRKAPKGELIELWQTMRTQVLDYLAANSTGRQAEIAVAVGLRRERINAYIVHRKGLTDVRTIQELWNWKIADEKLNPRKRCKFPAT